MSRRRAIRRAAAAAHESTLLHGLARAGLLFNGVLHLIIGGLAFAIAFGEKTTANHDGALAQLSAGPIGGPLLWATVIGFWGFALFQLLTLALVRGLRRNAWVARAKPFGRAIAFAALGWIAFRFATGNSPEGSEAQAVSADLLSHPGGVLGVFAIAVVLLAVGISFVVIGIRQRFLKDIRSDRTVVNTVARVFGTVGYIAKGIAFLTIGVLFGLAAFTADAHQAGGLDGALGSLRSLPAGNVVLSVVALGFMLFGLYCFIRAKYERLERASSR
jgi:hypothetical protein